MKTFGAYHPVSLLIYFTLILIITMFLNIPVILLLSLTGAAGYQLLSDRDGFLHGMLFDFLFFVIIAAANPVFTHRGKTVLFFMNGRPVTMEALIYGSLMAVMMLAVIHWCRILTKIMTSDKLLYLCGKLTPNLSIVLSMALRYIPLFRIQSARVNHSQTAMGLYTGDSYTSKARGSMRIFSIVLTWSLENAVDTANSMRARGYGMGKRSQFIIYRMTAEDIILIIMSSLLAVITLYGCSSGIVSCQYYPKYGSTAVSGNAVWVYLACGMLALLPVLIELKERLKWNYYRSKI